MRSKRAEIKRKSMKNTFAWAILLIASVAMTACSGAESSVDYASCQVDIFNNPKRFTALEERDYTYQCMVSKGYLHSTEAALCKSFMAQGIIAKECYVKPGLTTTLRNLFGV